MCEPHPQAFRRRTSELLELMKDIAWVGPQLSREHPGSRTQLE